MTSGQLVDLVDLKGKKVGEVSLDEAVFGVEIKNDVIFNSLVRQLANARSGCASTKTRAEVRGGGRKPWRQKGTGRARHGSIRSPLWAGGGVTFGPKPRDYAMSMPRKMRRLAVMSALSARKNDLVVVKNFDEVAEPKTKLMSAVLKSLNLSGAKVLLVLDFECEHCLTVERAARNIAMVKVVRAANLSVKDLLEADKVLTSERTVEFLTRRLKGDKSCAGAPSPAKKQTAKAACAAEADEAAKVKAPRKKAAPGPDGEAKAPRKKKESAE